MIKISSQKDIGIYKNSDKRTNKTPKITAPIENKRYKSVTKDYLAYIYAKRGEEFPYPKINPKVNYEKIRKMLSECGFSNDAIDKQKPVINKIAGQDFIQVEEKIRFLKNELSARKILSSEKDLSDFVDIVSKDEFSPLALKTIFSISKERAKRACNPSLMYDGTKAFMRDISLYENFENLSTSEQQNLIQNIEFDIKDEQLEKLLENADLMKFRLAKDSTKAGSYKNFQKLAIKRLSNRPIEAIKVSSKNIENFLFSDKFSPENLDKIFSSLDMKKYKTGLPLKYSRQNFINDFKNAINNLDNSEKNEVYKHFRFFIDENGAMAKFPTPKEKIEENTSAKAKEAILKTKNYVNDFVLNNEFRLDSEDKAAEEFLNEFIKSFPEFVSCVGKLQHRGDSIDHHTLEVLKLCISNPKIKDLSKNEQRILFLATMFHDIAKKEKELDHGHQKNCANWAKEIVKKAPISNSEKRRIYNLVLKSHFATDGTNAKDLGAIFRYKNDLKMAQILGKADANSIGFQFKANEDFLKEIEENTNKIYENMTPLFMDKLPQDKSRFEKDENGLILLDFTDKENDLEKFGFSKGTKVKDLNLLSHGTSTQLDELITMCDDSKEVCLSAMLLNIGNGFKNNYNVLLNAILNSENEDIAILNPNLGRTGSKKGFEHFKNFCYMEDEPDMMDLATMAELKKEIPNILKEKFGLNDELYAEFFKKVCTFNNKNGIEDIHLSDGKILKSEEIKKAIFEIQNLMLNGEKNEVVVFQPKVDAIIVPKAQYEAFKIEPDLNKIFAENLEIAKENNIAVILV